jgi:hypothetical protein
MTLIGLIESREIAVWCVLGLLATVGLLAVLSPRRFQAIATRGSQWVDTNRLLSLLDRRVDVDQYLLPASRSLGAIVLLATVLLGFLFVRYF